MPINTFLAFIICGLALVGVSCGIINLLEAFGVFDRPEHETYDYTLDEPENGEGGRNDNNS